MPNADEVIAILHAGHDELVPVVESLTPDQLTGPSAASEWTVAQVLSHMGSGAVITAEVVRAALDGRAHDGQDFNRGVWDRWNAMTPQEQRAGFVAANVDLLALYDSIDGSTRESLQVDLGFLPAPVPLADAAVFRLNEFALHSWDVRVVMDPAATLQPGVAALLLGPQQTLFGWLARPAALDGRTVTMRVDLVDPEHSMGVTLGGQSSLGPVPEAPDAILRATGEAWVRLVSGRLAPQWTPAAVAVEGALDLDTLRAVFPGY